MISIVKEFPSGLRVLNVDGTIHLGREVFYAIVGCPFFSRGDWYVNIRTKDGPKMVKISPEEKSWLDAHCWVEARRWTLIGEEG